MATFGGHKVTVGAYRDPTTGMREAFRNIGSRADKRVLADEEEIRRQEDLALKANRQNVLDSRYTAGLEREAKDRTYRIGRDTKSDTAKTEAIALEADKYAKQQRLVERKQAQMLANSDYQNYLYGGGKEADYKQIDTTIAFNERYKDVENFVNVAGIGDMGKVVEHGARMKSLKDDSRKTDALMSDREAKQKYMQAMADQSKIKTDQNPVFQAKVDATEGFQLPGNVEAAYERVKKARGITTEKLGNYPYTREMIEEVDRSGTDADKGILDSYGQLMARESTRYGAQRDQSTAEKMIAIGDEMYGNTAYNLDLNKFGMTKEISKVKADEKTREQLRQAFTDKAKMSKSTGKTIAGTIKETGIATKMRNALEFSGKRKLGVEGNKVLLKLEGAGYSSNQQAKGLGAKGSFIPGESNWILSDTPNKLDYDKIVKAIGELPENKMAVTDTKQMDTYIAQLQQRLNKTPMEEQDYAQYQKSLGVIDQAAAEKVTKPTEPKVKVRKETPEQLTVKEIKADLATAIKIKDNDTVRELKGDLRRLDEKKRYEEFTAVEDLKQARVNALAAGDRALAKEIQAKIDAR